MLVWPVLILNFSFSLLNDTVDKYHIQMLYRKLSLILSLNAMPKKGFLLAVSLQPGTNISYMSSLVGVTRHRHRTTFESVMAKSFLTRVYAVLG